MSASDLAQVCPWDNWEPSTMTFCEAHLCSWIKTPANTWSNLAFVFAGLYILRHCRRHDQWELNMFGFSAVLLGLFSGLFHASHALAFQVLDLLGMYFISGLMITYNVRRWLRWGPTALNALFWSLVIASAVVVKLFPDAGVPLFALEITAAITIELILHIRDFGRVNYRGLYGFVGAFAVSFTVWILDVQGIVCDPHNHFISGHAVWHVLNSLAILFLYIFHAQFKQAVELDTPGSGQTP